MKNKIVYGSDKDDFIWKMETTYNPIEKLHLRLAKWHLRKIIKVDKEMLDKLWLECYNNIIKESLEYPWKEYSLDKDMVNKMIERVNKVGCINAVSSEDIKRGLENTAKALDEFYTYTNHMWDNCYPYPIDIDFNAVVKLEGDENVSNN